MKGTGKAKMLGQKVPDGTEASFMSDNYRKSAYINSETMEKFGLSFYRED